MLLIDCCSGSSDNPSLNLLAILSPESGEVLCTNSVEIVISLNENAGPSTFYAWLNGKEITDRFTLRAPNCCLYRSG